SLADAEYEMMDRFVTAMGQASLLCDLVDAESVGLQNAQRVMVNHPEAHQVGIRVDSGNIAEQCVLYFQRMKQLGIEPRLIVADASEPPQGEPLYVKLVEQWRILYRETFQEQAARAERTWGRYRRVALSPLVGEYQRRFNAMREREIALARKP